MPTPDIFQNAVIEDVPLTISPASQALSQRVIGATLDPQSIARTTTAAGFVSKTGSVGTSSLTAVLVTGMSITLKLAVKQQLLLIYNASWDITSSGTAGTGNAVIKDDTAGVSLTPTISLAQQTTTTDMVAPCIIHAYYTVPSSGSRTFSVYHYVGAVTNTSTMSDRSFSISELGTNT